MLFISLFQVSGIFCREPWFRRNIYEGIRFFITNNLNWSGPVTEDTTTERNAEATLVFQHVSVNVSMPIHDVEVVWAFHHDVPWVPLIGGVWGTLLYFP